MSETKIKIKWPKLDPVFKGRWIDALISGEFKRGTGKLHSTIDNTFCCLGVAACIQGIPVNKLVGYGIIPRRFNKYLSKNKKAKIPEVLLENNEVVITQLIDMNDHKKGSFKKIARWIDKNL